MNILLVDDDISSVSALANLLEHEHDLKIASNGFDALNLLKKNRYDVVITDIMMPRMNGVELIKSTRVFDKDINVIVMTGYPTERHMRSIEQYNVSAFYSKPLDVENFMDMLSKIEKDRFLKKSHENS